MSLSIEVPMTPDEFFSNSHKVTLGITKIDDTHAEVEVFAYGGSDNDEYVLAGGNYVASSLFIGSRFASNIEPIKICGIQTFGQGDEIDFLSR